MRREITLNEFITELSKYADEYGDKPVETVGFSSTQHYYVAVKTEDDRKDCMVPVWINERSVKDA